ncbi:MAG: hypothetical protein CSA81_13135 [Acidobacteria bacterium]|nr:MAG: hypothetical protein CSA81_13135 [Acidobacteriota bacterium]PIE89161.1 MAG: hypothetical protein CR997_12870 [Acidobacteriota bacterium]
MSSKKLFIATLIFIAFFWLHQTVGLKLGLIKEVPIEQEVSEPLEPGKDELAVADQKPSKAGQLEAEEQPEQTDASLENANQDEEKEPPIEPEQITLRNDFLEVVLDNKGAVIRSAALLNFYETVKHRDRVRLVTFGDYAPGEVIYANQLRTGNHLFKIEEQSSRSVVFKAVLQGQTIVKTYTLTDQYALELDIDISGSEQEKYKMILAEGLEPLGGDDSQERSMFSAGSPAPKLMEVVWSENGDHESEASKDIESPQFVPLLEQEDILFWAGIKDTYFCNVFLPEKPFNQLYVKSRFIQTADDKKTGVPVVAVEVGGQVKGVFYLGPLNQEELEHVDKSLLNMINYGWTGSLTKWLFMALKGINQYVHNWGWSIVILTIFIRLLLFPLTAPSIKSGYRMRQLQPKIEELKKKYSGKDMETKQKLSQETWKLYKKEKVNPFSSCITILPQMPIFFAYFSLLRTSISLRQSEWLGWINDLSASDPVFVLPVLWGASMFLSQSMTPMPGDATQQKMMKFMPIMMTLFFLSMPSGLVLYMLTSNLFQLGQTVLFKWRYEKA